MNRYLVLSALTGLAVSGCGDAIKRVNVTLTLDGGARSSGGDIGILSTCTRSAKLKITDTTAGSSETKDVNLDFTVNGSTWPTDFNTSAVGLQLIQNHKYTFTLISSVGKGSSCSTLPEKFVYGVAAGINVSSGGGFKLDVSMSSKDVSWNTGTVNSSTPFMSGTLSSSGAATAGLVRLKDSDTGYIYTYSANGDLTGSFTRDLEEIPAGRVFLSEGKNSTSLLYKCCTFTTPGQNMGFTANCDSDSPATPCF